ncbi:MAG: DUF1800 domain-containing protein [Thiotrichaceae bacterium]
MDKLGFDEARHLVSRTGFGPEWNSIQRLIGKPMPQAVDMILKQRNSNPPGPPAMTHWSKLVGLRNNMSRRKMVMRISKTEGDALQKWWVKHLLTTQAPFVERMTLFWHNVFPSTITKTLSATLLHQQNLMLRKHALGNYRTLLHAVAKDPAMLVYLDGNQNLKEEPNENFAREVLELFTVGRGKYNENDIREAAKAFTGWTINDRSGRFVNNASQHFTGPKTILGQTGNFNGDQALDIMLKHPRTPERIAERLWKEFISVSHPNPAIIKRWTQKFVHSNYDITTLLKTVLTCDAFWAASNRGALIKSPIDLAVGTLRALPVTLPRNNLAHQLKLMGQPLFDQSTVKGWATGEDWLSTQSLLLRDSLLRNLNRGNMRSAKSGMDRHLPKISKEEMAAWLLPIPPSHPFPEKEGNKRLVRALMLDPVYQVY